MEPSPPSYSTTPSGWTNPHSPVPDVPGQIVDDETHYFLREFVQGLCRLNNPRFPGSQPVSFVTSSLELLEKHNFWVCEKSDGVRVMVLIVMKPGTSIQQVFLIDRHNVYREVAGLRFPRFDRPEPLNNTLLDGELVIDQERDSSGKVISQKLRLLAFDCVVYDGTNLWSKALSSRYGRLKEWIVKPYERMVAQNRECAAKMPFEVVLKPQEKSYAMDVVFREHLPRLKHGNDGLIFTCEESGYVQGTDQMILKWKPPSENSIDFKLELRFPPSVQDSSRPDLAAKPAFMLFEWKGREDYKFFDFMLVTDEEWERIKESGEQWDDRIVEVVWDFEMEGWRHMRFRDDKPHGNHSKTVGWVLQSIKEGVEAQMLIDHGPRIRDAWKARQNQQKAAHLPSAAAAQAGPQLGPGPGPVMGATLKR